MANEDGERWVEPSKKERIRLVLTMALVARALPRTPGFLDDQVEGISPRSQMSFMPGLPCANAYFAQWQLEDLSCALQGARSKGWTSVPNTLVRPFDMLWQSLAMLREPGRHTGPGDLRRWQDARHLHVCSVFCNAAGLVSADVAVRASWEWYRSRFGGYMGGVHGWVYGGVWVGAKLHCGVLEGRGA